MSSTWVKELAKRRKIWVYTQAVDFRKQIDGLVQIIENEMETSSSEGLYVFQNRQKDKIKIIVWDRNGYLLGYKRLSRGRFDFPIRSEETVSMTAEELSDLLSGMPVIQLSVNGQKLYTH